MEKPYRKAPTPDDVENYSVLGIKFADPKNAGTVATALGDLILCTRDFFWRRDFPHIATLRDDAPSAFRLVETFLLNKSYLNEIINGLSGSVADIANALEQSNLD